MKPVHSQSEVVARMTETRSRLIAAHALDEPMPPARPRPGAVAVRAPHTRSEAGPWLLQTPNAALIALALIGLVVLGPRRLLQSAVGAGLSASLSRAAREVFGNAGQ
jgi:hypothetical protein